MPYSTSLSDHCAEQAIVERLFRASLDLHSALSIIREERTANLLREAIDRLDQSIKQVQSRALDLDVQLRRGPSRAGPVTDPEPRMSVLVGLFSRSTNDS
jgi:hypothetical protein